MMMPMMYTAPPMTDGSGSLETEKKFPTIISMLIT